jgi:hypothetical protein
LLTEVARPSKELLFFPHDRERQPFHTHRTAHQRAGAHDSKAVYRGSSLDDGVAVRIAEP